MDCRWAARSCFPVDVWSTNLEAGVRAISALKLKHLAALETADVVRQWPRGLLGLSSGENHRNQENESEANEAGT
jgi:hypothetical protein